MAKTDPAAPSSAIYFVYDEAGHLLGEYDSTGTVIEDTVWLGDLPVATVLPNQNWFIAPDHLGAPHQITDANRNVVWQWDHDPFGNGAPTGTFTYNLRFPGQYFDAETGLYYNGFRDYDPRLGRYIESDPIGLAGGINTYSYAGSDPVDATDGLGLCPLCFLYVAGVEWGPALLEGAAFGVALYTGAPIPGAAGLSAAGNAVKTAAGAAGKACRGLANQNPLYKAALRQFKSSDLSNAGRALTKHPELIGETKDTLRQLLRSDDAINDAAQTALKNIMQNGVVTMPTLGRYGTVTQIQIPGGFGARWASDGTFIGFINP